MASGPGTWREPHTDVHFPFSEALELWTKAAVPILEHVASEYGGYIFYKDLGERLFESTGVHTRTQLGNWIGKPLGGVLRYCQDRGLPALSSLVVRSGNGMVGEGFNEYLRIAGRETIDNATDLEWVAAEERLRCYRIYCPDMPADAKPHLTSEYAQTIRRKEPKTAPPPSSCLRCGTVLPLSMQCDYCED